MIICGLDIEWEWRPRFTKQAHQIVWTIILILRISLLLILTYHSNQAMLKLRNGIGSGPESGLARESRAFISYFLFDDIIPDVRVRLSEDDQKT